MKYIPCELHCHTLNSDGGFTVKELLESAKSDGLCAIALTDHNTFSGHKDLDDNIIPAVRGIEWTTYFGHMLVLGAEKFVDWRDAVPGNIDKKISEVKKTGGIVGIAHPFQHGSPICTGGRWEFNVSDWEQVDYIEIWHEAFGSQNTENDRAFEFWTNLLDKGYKIAAVYGRDWHRKENGGHFGCTYVGTDGETNTKNTFEGIKNGRTVPSSGAKFYFTIADKNCEYHIGDTVLPGEYRFNFFTDFKAREKNYDGKKVTFEEIKIVTNSSKTVFSSDLQCEKTILALSENHWYRAELWGKIDEKREILAVTSPIYCKKYLTYI